MRLARTKKTALAAILGLAATALTGLTSAGCSSLSKPKLEAALRALPKNARVQELERAPLRADLGDGPADYELVYLRAPAPDPQGAPVVLVHGTPSTLFTWVELVYGGPGFEGLAARRDVYAIEVIGHGIAPGDAAPYDFDRCARFVSAALGALGLERAHLVGNSYGGEIAWRAALEAPERVASLTLINSSGYPRRDEDWLSEEVQMRENPLAKIGWVLNSRERIERALAPHFGTIPPDRVEEFFLVCENATNWKAMIDLARDENGTRASELPSLRAPTLVLWGENEIAYPLDVYGRRFANEIPDAELMVLEDAGHFPHEERPAEVAQVLERFLDGLEAP